MVKVTWKVASLASAVLLTLSFSTPSYAVVSPNKVLVGFQNYLREAQSTYEKSYAVLTSDFRMNIATRETAIANAKKDFLSFNKVKVVKLGDNRNYWGSFNCPQTRPSCIDVDKGPKFEVGEVTSMKDVIADNPAYLDEIDLIVSLGLIELLYPVDFNRASTTIRSETKAIAAAKAKYFQETQILDNKLSDSRVVEPAVLAAKRAAKNPRDYERAFVVALQFAYNQKRLDELANLPFRYIDSLKSLDSAVKITKLSNSADAVADRYTMNGALGINRTCGKTFVSEAKFRSMSTKVFEVYREITGRSLKL